MTYRGVLGDPYTDEVAPGGQRLGALGYVDKSKASYWLEAGLKDFSWVTPDVWAWLQVQAGEPVLSSAASGQIGPARLGQAWFDAPTGFGAAGRPNAKAIIASIGPASGSGRYIEGGGAITLAYPKPPGYVGVWPPKPDAGGWYANPARKMNKVLHGYLGGYTFWLLPILNLYRHIRMVGLLPPGSLEPLRLNTLQYQEFKRIEGQVNGLIGKIKPPWHNPKVSVSYLGAPYDWGNMFFWWMPQEIVKRDDLLKLPQIKKWGGGGFGEVGQRDGGEPIGGTPSAIAPPWLTINRKNMGAEGSTDTITLKTGIRGNYYGIDLRYSGFPFPQVRKSDYKLTWTYNPDLADIAAWETKYNAGKHESAKIMATVENVKGKPVVTIWNPVRMKEPKEGGVVTKALQKIAPIAPVAMLIPGVGTALAIAIKAASIVSTVEQVQGARAAEGQIRDLEKAFTRIAEAGALITVGNELAFQGWADRNPEILLKAGTTPAAFNKMNAGERAVVLSKISIIKLADGDSAEKLLDRAGTSMQEFENMSQAERDAVLAKATEITEADARRRKIITWSAIGVGGLGIFGFVIYKIAKRK
jgi:hypothetical protein